MNNAFVPVRGLDKNIQSTEYTDGYLYFATDTGKIYIDANNQNKVLMGGGGVSLFYANDDTVEEKPDGTYVVSIDTLEDSSALKIDDLIINQSNGCFYKVSKINWESNTIICSLIAVSGTGGGTSGGPGGSETSNISMEVTGISNRMTFVYGEPAFIKVAAEAKLDSTVLVTYEIIGVNNTTVYNSEFMSGSFEEFDIGSKLHEGTNKINVYIESNNSGSTYRSYTSIMAVRMSLTPGSNVNPARVIKEDERSLNFTVIGAGIEKEVNAYIDGISIFNKKVTAGNTSVEIVLPGAKTPTDPNNMARQNHGQHELKVTMSATVNGRTISVPTLLYEFAWVESTRTEPIIWFGKLPKTVINYTVASAEYMVYDPLVAEGRSFDIKLMKNGEVLAESPRTIAYNSNNMLVWNISNYDIGANTYTIDRNGTSRSFDFIAEADTTRDMEIIKTNLYLSLDSKGRSNNEASYNRDKWIYKNSNGKTFTPIFENFNWYNNGWIENKDNISALRISNGANLSIPLESLFKTNALPNSLTFEFQFEVKNTQNYITMIQNSVGSGEGTGEDKDNDGIEDTESIDTSSIRADWNNIAFADFYRNQVGFALGPSDFFLQGGGTLAYARYKENSLINVSIVIDINEKLIYLYINGILSQIKKCENKNFYNETSSLNFYPTTCDLDLYKVRIYTRALSYNEIVHNVLADLKDVLTYDANQITKLDAYGNQTIDLIALQAYNQNNPDNPSMPYAILKINDKEATMLPYIKGGKVKCDITFVNPSLDRAYETGELAQAAAAANMSVEDYYTYHCPSFKKIQGEVDVQGTSSQGYPRRNYKLKCKSGGSWVLNKGPFEKENKEITKMYLDNSRGEPTFTWKADYMESSGTHNSGLTSYVKTLYDKHPLGDYYNPDTIENYEDLRTTIYGFPMLVFEEKADGSYEFIGKYNFNLDKDCPTVTGMKFDRQHPILTNKKMSEVCECWEMCNNKGTRTAFKTLDYDEIVGEVIDEETGESYIDYSLTLPEDIEYRYISDEDGLDDLLDNPSVDNNKKALEYYKNIQALAEWLYWLDTEPSQGADNDLGRKLDIPFTYNGVTHTYDTKEYRLAKFDAEFEKHFDMEYMLIYFIVTELLVLYDSRGKNMMLASWGPQEQGGEYIWYPIFYDVDTQLGIDNSGVPLWDYDVNPTENRVFSTPGSVIWTNFFATKLTQIKNKYADLRKTKLDFEKLNGYYDFNPTISGSYAMQGIRPYVAYNADEFFKYIAPAKDGYGYVTTEGKIAYTDTYYYCAQGTRELQRELFLTNRFYYLDSKWQAGDFSYNNIGSLVQTRLNSNQWEDTSDTIWGNKEDLPEGYVYPNEYDTLNYYNIKPFLNSYVGLFTDSTPSLSASVIKAGESGRVSVKSDVASKIRDVEKGNQGQLVYLCGKSYISSYGDLSRYYLNELDLNGANRLIDMHLGSDLDGYKNNYFVGSTTEGAKFVFDAKDGYPLLKEANFGRLNKYTDTVNLFKSEKLENFRALHSSIKGVNVPKGVQLSNCYLPKTIDTISFTEANNLNNILVEYPFKNYDTGIWPTGLYIEGLTNKLEEIKNKTVSSEQSAVDIGTFYLNGGFLGTDAYRLLEGLVALKVRMTEDWSSNTALNKKLSVNALNMNWSPYKKVEAGAINDPSIQYYQTTDQYTFTNYIYSTLTQWNKDTLNGKVFIREYDLTTDYPIKNLNLLDTLIDSYENDNYLYGTVENTIAYVSGDLYVNNTQETPIFEVDIQNKYLKYYPELSIHAAYTSPAITINYLEEADNGAEIQWGPQKYSKDGDLTKKVSPLEKTPIKIHYDFLGWSLTPGATEPDQKQPIDYTIAEIQALATDQNKPTVTFWAVYEIHKYKFLFYNYDGTPLIDNINNEVDEDGDLKTYTMYVPAGEYLSIPADIVPYRDDSKLGKYQTYDFKGYSLANNNIGPVIDLATIKSNRNLIFYAYYGNPMDVREIIHPEYFEVRNSNYRETAEWGNSIYDIENGVELNLIKPVKGKLTIPAFINNKPVLSLNSGFNTMGKDLTYVFFQKDSQLRVINENCFMNNKKLKEIEFPESLRRINASAFNGCSSLLLTNGHLSKNLAYIGTSAFNNAFDNTQGQISFSIDSSVTVIDYYAFANLNAQDAIITLGSVNAPSQFNDAYTISGNGSKVIFVAQRSSITSMNKKVLIYVYSNGRYDNESFMQFLGGDNAQLGDIT